METNSKINEYLKTLRCFELKEGLGITFDSLSGGLPAEVPLAFRGVKLWTVKEALKRQ